MTDETTTITPPTDEELREALRAVEDPELHMSIVDLGLVYGVEIDEDRRVTVDMTLTSPACPVGPMLQGLIFHKLSQMMRDWNVTPWNSDEVKALEKKIHDAIAQASA